MGNYNNEFFKEKFQEFIEHIINNQVDEECPICFETRKDLGENKFTVASLKCLHLICKDCKKTGIKDNQCPLCATPVSEIL